MPVPLPRFGALAFAPCLVSGRSLREAAALLALACSSGGMVSMVFATLCREPFGQESPNGWDEALTLVAASRPAQLAWKENSMLKPAPF